MQSNLVLVLPLLLQENQVSLLHVSLFCMELFVNIILVCLLLFGVTISGPLVTHASSSSKPDRSGILVFSTLLNSNSAGLFPVVESGMDLYAIKNLFNSSLQFFPSLWAALIAFNNALFCLNSHFFEIILNLTGY